jgi:hypothetical protein
MVPSSKFQTVPQPATDLNGDGDTLDPENLLMMELLKQIMITGWMDFRSFQIIGDVLMDSGRAKRSYLCCGS